VELVVAYIIKLPSSIFTSYSSGLTVELLYCGSIYCLINRTKKQLDFICVQAPPANNDCAGSIALTRATCINTSGTLTWLHPMLQFRLVAAAGTYYDVWYKFVATDYTYSYFK
jgi:hypothetical protein